MSKVTHFARYSQRENFATNNTLLLMYRLYEASRRQFQAFLASILDEKADDRIQEIGLQLRQQEPSIESVLDGYLHQPEVHIGIEAKGPAAPFHLDQLLKHLDRFPDGRTGYLLLLRPEKEDLSQKKWAHLHEKANLKGVVVSSITFQQIINSVRECLRPHDDLLHELIDDYEDFCTEETLLGAGEYVIFVPPCGASFSINENNALYFCPSDWRRKPTRYLGIYRQKSVQLIGEITKVAHCDLIDGQLIRQPGDGADLNLNESEQKRIRSAIAEARESNGWDITTGHKFFLCDRFVKTNYQKKSPGGIMGHRYFDIGGLLANKKVIPLDELARILAESSWT